MGKGYSDYKINEGNHKGKGRLIWLYKHFKVMDIKISQTKLNKIKQKTEHSRTKTIFATLNIWRFNINS